MREVGDKLRRFFAFGHAARPAQRFAAELMPVQAHDEPVRLPARFVNPAKIFFEIAWVTLRAHAKSFAGGEAVAAEVDSFFRRIATFFSFFLRIESQPALDAFKVFERFGIDDKCRVETKRIDSGPPRVIHALAASFAPRRADQRTRAGAVGRDQ